MKTRFIKEEINYTGKELRSHFAFESFNIIGDSLVAFCGECEVSIPDMVDLADVRDDAPIYSEQMLHFIGEFFDGDLERTILRQRLMITIIKDELQSVTANRLTRKGDDIYDVDSKISVSIATSTPVSTVLHIGINILSDNTPVKTRGLKDYGIEVEPFAEAVLKCFKAEMDGVREARCKVRGVS
jgi:hypothetical protein